MTTIDNVRRPHDGALLARPRFPHTAGCLLAHYKPEHGWAML